MSRVGAFHAPYNRRGQALVEFAVVSLVVYMLLAAILTFGQILYSAQGLQQAVDVAARELSRTPLPAVVNVPPDPKYGGSALEYVLYGPSTDPNLADVRKRVFDERYLVLSIDAGSNPMTFNGGHPSAIFR